MRGAVAVARQLPTSRRASTPSLRTLAHEAWSSAHIFRPVAPLGPRPRFGAALSRDVPTASTRSALSPLSVSLREASAHSASFSTDVDNNVPLESSERSVGSASASSSSSSSSPFPAVVVTDDDFAEQLKILGVGISDVMRYGAAVAVSGGPDSIALCLLLRRWIDAECAKAGISAADARRPILGITVDHAMRGESAAEAVRVKKMLQQIGLDHRILRVDWRAAGEGASGPKQNKHAIARRERYNTLRSACLELGVRLVLIAHHAGDQCETFLQRVVKGSRLPGLSGIPARRSLVPGGKLELLRPLLPFSKSDLESRLRAEGLTGWIHDPSNDSLAFDRGRIRSLHRSQSQHCNAPAEIPLDGADAGQIEARNCETGSSDSISYDPVTKSSRLEILLSQSAEILQKLNSEEIAPRQQQVLERFAMPRFRYGYCVVHAPNLVDSFRSCQRSDSSLTTDALRAIFLQCGPKDHPPSSVATQRIISKVESGLETINARKQRATATGREFKLPGALSLGGCMATWLDDQHLAIHRDGQGGLIDIYTTFDLAPPGLDHTVPVLWDNRFWVQELLPGSSLEGQASPLNSGCEYHEVRCMIREDLVHAAHLVTGMSPKKFRKSHRFRSVRQLMLALLPWDRQWAASLPLQILLSLPVVVRVDPQNGGLDNASAVSFPHFDQRIRKAADEIGRIMQLQTNGKLAVAVMEDFQSYVISRGFAHDKTGAQLWQHLNSHGAAGAETSHA